MTIDTFAVIGGDLRSAYLAGSLAADGYHVITAGFDGTDLPPCVTGCTHPAQAIAAADAVILPLPITTDDTTLNAPFARARIPLDQLWGALKPSQWLFGGAVNDTVRTAAAAHHLTLRDYWQREELAIANAVPTAEGALQLAMDELPITLHGARCLVTGFGRVGSVLAQDLVALGASVTVAARRSADLARAATQRCATIDLAQLTDAGEFDVIFNTVPALIFDRTRLHALDKNTLLIDLASRPGGVDFNAAAEEQIKTIWALSLPGRVAPKSAGQSIKQAILNQLREESL